METIKFIDPRYYESALGNYWPRVTTILEAYPKGEGFYSWLKATGKNADDILTTAGEVGTKVHHGTQEYDSGTTLSWVTNFWNKDEWALLCKYADFCSFTNPEILLTERSMVSDILQYGGTLDRVVNIDGVKLLIDIKTSNYIYSQHWCQVAAYRELLLEQDIEVDAVGILHLKAKTRKQSKSDTGYQGKGWTLEIKHDTTDDIQIFNKVYDLWRHENKDHIPGVKTLPSILSKNI